jgi:hypothetical protein
MLVNSLLQGWPGRTERPTGGSFVWGDGPESRQQDVRGQACRSQVAFTVHSQGRRLQCVLLPCLSAPSDLRTKHPSVGAHIDSAKHARVAVLGAKISPVGVRALV